MVLITMSVTVSIGFIQGLPIYPCIHLTMNIILLRCSTTLKYIETSVATSQCRLLQPRVALRREIAPLATLLLDDMVYYVNNYNSVKYDFIEKDTSHTT